ncbi:calcium-binding protein [Pseudoprimorskyibacter insulae]|uniref:Leukotoxin n=1 Tax=Pseudoprimorskyibacter insulae TaxID=1695997 RepID=A0A2R8AQF3_9RHOB|nr:calcium-binding protein [Pseudoprimorskyibacter insulae]SPF78200.1 Leukotoxin [Pseudoprimorskyibacter insulae]
MTIQYSFDAHLFIQRMNADWSEVTFDYQTGTVSVDVPDDQTSFTIMPYGGIDQDDLDGVTLNYLDRSIPIDPGSPIGIYKVTHSGGLVTDVLFMDVHRYDGGGNLNGFDDIYVAIGGDPLPDFADADAFNAWTQNSTGWWTPIETGPYAPGSTVSWEDFDIDTPIYGTDGADRLEGTNQSDTIYAQDGADTVIGLDGDDFIYGGRTTEDLRDVIYGGAGNDSIDGGYGNDELRGDAGDDSIEGGYGVDLVIGGDGNDVLTGSAWSDQIFGGNGNDFINGGFGFDRVNGGLGADKFYHTGNVGHGSDWIQDYDAAQGDVLFYGAAATKGDFLVQRATTASAGAADVQEVFITHKASGVLLWALIDGDAQASLNVMSNGLTFDLLA